MKKPLNLEVSFKQDIRKESYSLTDHAINRSDYAETLTNI